MDAVVVDLPTALYLTAAQVPSATIVGQFSAPGGDQWGALLDKGSSLTGCVSHADRRARSSGELGKIENRWMSKAAQAPDAELDVSAAARVASISRVTAIEATVGGRRAEREAAKGACPARPGDRGGVVADRDRRAGGAGVTSPGWPNVRDTFFSWSAFKDSFPDVLDGLLARRQDVLVVEVAVLVAGARHRARADQPRAGPVPAAAARDGLRGRVPRRSR